MIEKLKALGEAAKGVLLFIVTPLVFAAGVLFYFMSQSSRLQDELARKNIEKELDKANAEAEAAEKESNNEEAKFDNAYDQLTADYSEYSRKELSGTAPGSDGGSPASKGSDPKEG